MKKPKRKRIKIEVAFSEDMQLINTPFGLYQKVEITNPGAASVKVPKLENARVVTFEPKKEEE